MAGHLPHYISQVLRNDLEETLDMKILYGLQAFSLGRQAKQKYVGWRHSLEGCRS